MKRVVSTRQVVQNLPHAVVVLDERLRIVLANAAAASLFATTIQRLEGASLTLFVPQDDLGELLCDFSLRTTRVIETAARMRRRDHVTPALRVTASPLEVADGDLRVLVLEDITHRAELEQQLVDVEKKVAMGQLAAGILHEVSNPVTSIGANLLFVRDALAAEAHPELTQALDACLDQLNGMRQLLGTLSGVTGRTVARYELADLHDLIRRCVTFIAKDAEARQIQIAVAFAAQPTICEVDVRAIKQVLLNLLKNAMDAMPAGGRLFVRTSRRSGSGDGQVIVEIGDTGIGIASADLRKIFRPLFSTKPRGAGLGLSFCRQAVEEHGGQIRLASRGPNLGAVASVTLPLNQIDSFRECR